MSQPAAGISDYTTPSDHEVVCTRIFDAPRDLVFAAWTEPRYLTQWLLGPEDGWTMPICEIDLRPGGAWRYGWQKPSGQAFEITGTVVEVASPERLVITERWGAEWPESVNTLVLTESEGQTTMELTQCYASKEARDAALATGMTRGMDASFGRLDRIVAAA